ncbi:MAG: response regulator, partial [Desulfobacteraceae bacterium]|nr:response regulator [Desulfobacteraceae bacterium]
METTAKIMVVDDEKQICQNVKKILAKNDYEVSYAISAKEALDKMAKEAFSLLISDVVMPGMNGLELLKLVKDQWPLTKVIMITAYASTDTAVKAVKLGALDYMPKPFTPDELRSRVGEALAGKLVEAPVTEKEREAIDIIDIDIPFDRDEVAKYAGEEYAEMLGPSDMPMPVLEYFCEVGGRVCLDVFMKLGHTCKKGLKTGKCPQDQKKAAAKEKAFDAKTLISIDHPFNYEEVASITGPEYVLNLHRDGMSSIPYEELKSYEELRKDVALLKEREAIDIVDVDIPFDRDEVAKYAGEEYAETLGPSDMPMPVL